MALTLEQLAFQVLDPGLDVAWGQGFQDRDYVQPPVPGGHVPVWDDLEDYLLAQASRPQPLVVTGQLGAGKSMLISRLISSPKVRSQFEVLPLAAQRDAANEIDDIRVLLVLVIQHLGAFIESKTLHRGVDVGSGPVERISGVLAGWLKLLRDGGPPPVPEVLQKATTKFSGEFLELSYEIVRDRERREQLFKDDLYSAAQLLRVARALVELIEIGLTAENGHSPRFLLAIDGLDKSVSDKAVQSLFYEGFRGVLANLGCMTILTVPYFLTFDAGFEAVLGPTRRFAVQNVKVVAREPDGSVKPIAERVPDAAAVDFFSRMLGALHADAPKLVAAAALARTAVLSAGVPRQFLALLHRAAIFARRSGSPVVDVASVELARAERARELAKTATRVDDQARLKLVQRLHRIQGFSKLFESLHIVEYVNHESWYSVHPALEELVEGWIRRDRLELAAELAEHDVERELIARWRQEAGLVPASP